MEPELEMAPEGPVLRKMILALVRREGSRLPAQPSEPVWRRVFPLPAVRAPGMAVLMVSRRMVRLEGVRPPVACRSVGRRRWTTSVFR